MSPLIKKMVQRFLQRARLGELYRGPSASDFLASRGVDLVIDVGANEGQYAKGLRATGYNGAIQSFEPIAAMYTRLAMAAASDPNWYATQTAIGASKGHATIGVSRNTVFSSIKPLSDQAAKIRREYCSGGKRNRTIKHARLGAARCAWHSPFP